MTLLSKVRSYFLKRGIRVRFAVGVALPILLVMTLMSLLHYWRERQFLEEQVQLATMQLGELMISSLHHAMMANDTEMIIEMLADMNKLQDIEKVQLVNLDGVVTASTHDPDMGITRHLDDMGCKECHQNPSEPPSRTALLASSSNMMRISTPVDNVPDCQVCHSEQDAHLGVLLTDVSLVNTQQHLLNTLRNELLITVIVALGITLGVQSIHFLVVRRRVKLRASLAQLAAGDLSTRVPVAAGPIDEQDKFAHTLNLLAEELEIRARELEELNDFRKQAIIEERKRIARELHDGIAQFLGYVRTKTKATRLMLENRDLETADKNLSHLDASARDVSIDVYEAILGLKMVELDGTDLIAQLQNYVAKFNQFSDVLAELEFTPEVEGLLLSVEAELQLLRIVQEALTNVRKHAAATHTWIGTHIDDDILVLTVKDNGLGFDPNDIQTDQRTHFGLGTMRERAEMLNATFNVHTEAGTGTCISIHLPLKDN